MSQVRIKEPIVGLMVVPGCAHTLTVDCVKPDGTAFDLTGYSIKAKVQIGLVEETITGTIVSAAGGTSTVTLANANTTDYPTATNGTITLYADPSAGSENLHISTVLFRTANEVVP